MNINPIAFFIGWWLESTDEEDQPAKPKPKKKPRTEAQRLNIQLVAAGVVIVVLLGLITVYEGGLR